MSRASRNDRQSRVFTAIHVLCSEMEASEILGWRRRGGFGWGLSRLAEDSGHFQLYVDLVSAAVDFRWRIKTQAESNPSGVTGTLGISCFEGEAQGRAECRLRRERFIDHRSHFVLRPRTQGCRKRRYVVLDAAHCHVAIYVRIDECQRCG